MIHFFPISAPLRRGMSVVLGMALAGMSGCSFLPSPSHATSSRQNQQVMRTSLATTLFQPLPQAQSSRYQSLGSSLTSTRLIQSDHAATPQMLPLLTPVKVLKLNKLFALVELKNGRRGFIPVSSIASDEHFFSATAALKALPVPPANAGYDPATGLPYGIGGSREMITVDPLVDQAMLNDVDKIQLPESEAEFHDMHPEAQIVDDVLLRQPLAETSPVHTSQIVH